MMKKFEHKNPEVCVLCGKEIGVNSDEWAAIIDFEGKKQTATKFYHRKCLTDLLLGKGEVIKQKFEERLQKFVRKMFGGVDLQNTQFGIRLNELTT